MANGQVYCTIKDCLQLFITENPKFIPKTSAANISRLSGVNSAKTVAKFLKYGRVSSATATAVFKLCAQYGYEKSFEESIDLVQN